jgi:heptaprenyl diphosphate synthase
LIQQLTNLKKLTYISALIALGIVLNFLEPPIFVFIPGFRIGFANISSVIGLIIFGPLAAIGIAFFRTILGALMKGALNPIQFGTSVVGGVLAAVVMGMIYKFFGKNFSITGISIIGGLINNLGQFFVVLLITKNNAFWIYLPILLVFGGLSGWLIGILSQMIYNKMKKI